MLNELESLKNNAKRARREARRAEEELREAERDFYKTQAKQQRIEAPISIQDIVVIGQHPEPGASGSYGTGEHDSRGITHNPGSVEHANAQKRMLKTIKQFITHAANAHKINCYNLSGQLQPDKENHITRLSTNEFSFYTNRPLELSEFQALMGDIAKFAAQQPENLHLALSSFAVVRTLENGERGVINVVPYVQCGPDPQIDFAVKNLPSPVDPVYATTIHLPNNSVAKIPLPNHGIASNPSPIPDKDFIRIRGKYCPISYNNTIKCKTAGGAEFYASIDICLDHYHKTAQKNFKLLEATAKKSSSLYPVQKWLLITSNWIEAEKSACSRRTTYADMLSAPDKEPSKRFSTCQPKLESTLASTGMTTTFPQSSPPNYKTKSYRREDCAISPELENHNDQILREKQRTVVEAQRKLIKAHSAQEYAEDRYINYRERYDLENTSSRYPNSRSDKGILTSYDRQRHLGSNRFKPYTLPSNRDNNHRRPKK